LYVCYSILLIFVAMSLIRAKPRVADVLDQAHPGPMARWKVGPLIDLPRSGLKQVPALVIAYVGLGLGFLSGLLGIGGGVALMPVMIYGFGFPIRYAAGTGVMVLIVGSATATLSHVLRGNVNLGLAMSLLLCSSLFAQLGARLSSRLPPRIMRKLFAFLLLSTVGVLVYDIWNQAQHHRTQATEQPSKASAGK
jgi:uncharacterized protein